MIKLEKYTGEKTYMFPNGSLATPEVIQGKYPAVDSFAHIVETDSAGEVLFAIENLAATRSLNGVDPALSEDEAIAALEAQRNAPPPEPEPSAEERIAAALEYQNLLTL